MGWIKQTDGNYPTLVGSECKPTARGFLERVGKLTPSAAKLVISNCHNNPGCWRDCQTITTVKHCRAMTYSEAIEFLYGLQVFGARPGLEPTRHLAALAGNPQHGLRFIHVAGTNGKGSTCAILESIYRAAGLRVGLFTSPHLVSFRERMQVNRQLISTAAVADLVAEIRAGLEKFPPEQHPTMFEIVTGMALRYFAQQKCDLVIWETGLGGRLDATNIVTPLASVITNIGFDHQQWLGETLAAIAAEKAGIIKPGIPVLTAAEQPEVLRVIEQTARRQRSLFIAVPAMCVMPDAALLPLAGAHQARNAALALATVQALQSQIPVNVAALHAGLQGVQWPGRLQLVDRGGGRKLLLDGAHNGAGVTALLAALQTIFPQQKPTLILGMLADKEWRGMGRQLATASARIFTVPVANPRTVSASELAEVCQRDSPQEVVPCESLAAALAQSATDSFVLITGSLYLVGEALELLGCAPEAACAERSLNEWTGGKPPAPMFPGCGEIQKDKDQDHR